MQKLNLEIEEWPLKRFGGEKFTPRFEQNKIVFKPFQQKLKIPIITIGGTNGKGETAHNLKYLFHQEGKNVGLWTSPHVLSIRERFFVGEEVSYPDLLGQFEKSYQEVKENNFTLSYYEFLFHVFLSLCVFKKVDVLILEVGLGGRLDAVNYLDPSLTAITSISRDHQEFLGNSFNLILREKLGIARPGIPLVTAFELKYLRSLATTYCRQNLIPYIDMRHKELIPKNANYSDQNRLMAIELKQHIDGKAQSDKNMTFPLTKGRFERVTIGRINITFVGAHNLEGMRKLVARLKGKDSFDELYLSFSRRPEEEIKQCIKIFGQNSEMFKKIHLTSFEHPKAAGKIDGALSYLENWKDNLEQDLEQKEKKNILVTGSYYFIGEFQKVLSKHSANSFS